MRLVELPLVNSVPEGRVVFVNPAHVVEVYGLSLRDAAENPPHTVVVLSTRSEILTSRTPEELRAEFARPVDAFTGL